MKAKPTDEQTYRELMGHIWAIGNIIKGDNFLRREINQNDGYESGTYGIELRMINGWADDLVEAAYENYKSEDSVKIITTTLCSGR